MGIRYGDAIAELGRGRRGFSSIARRLGDDAPMTCWTCAARLSEYKP